MQTGAVKRLLLLLALAACSRDPAPVQMSRDRIGDPALAAAIAAPIMIDPGLGQSANADAIRPPTAPDPIAVPPDPLGRPDDPGPLAGLRHAPAPTACPACRIAHGALTLGALAERQPRRDAATCAASIRYAGDWADRLPPALPLPPATRVVEAAGSDAPGCALRLASLDSSMSAVQLID